MPRDTDARGRDHVRGHPQRLGGRRRGGQPRRGPLVAQHVHPGRCRRVRRAARRGGRLVAQSAATSLMHAASLRCSLPALLEDVPPADDASRATSSRSTTRTGAGSTPTTSSCSARSSPTGASRSSPGRSSTSPTSAASPPAAWPRWPPTRSAKGCCFPRCGSYQAGEPVARRPADHRPQQPGPRQGPRRRRRAHRGRQRHRAAASTSSSTRYGADGADRFVERSIGADRAADARRARRPARGHLPRLVHDRRRRGGARPHLRGARRGRHVGDGRSTSTSPGPPPQARGPINASVVAGAVGRRVRHPVLRRPDDPDERRVLRADQRCSCPPGSLVNPNPPAACGGRIVTVAAAVEAILEALAAARPTGPPPPAG